MRSRARLTLGSISQLALEVAELRGQLGRLGVLGGPGGLGDDVDIRPGEGRVRRVVEVGQLFGDLDAALPAGGGDLAYLAEVAGDPLGVALDQQPRQLARHLYAELVLEDRRSPRPRAVCSGWSSGTEISISRATYIPTLPTAGPKVMVLGLRPLELGRDDLDDRKCRISRSSVIGYRCN